MLVAERRPTLAIRLFGPELHISYAGLPLSGSAAPKTRALLAYLLLLGPEFVSRETLASALWPDSPDSRARKNLRRHLSMLAKYLAPYDGGKWLILKGSFVRWNRAAPASIDVLEFDELGSSPATRAYAVELYAGDILSAADEEWLEPIRERYRARAAAWLFALFEAHEPYDLASCLRYGRAFLDVEWQREDVLRRMMRRCAEGGDRSGALRDFSGFRDRLEREIGVAPAPETIVLADEIRAARPTKTRPVVRTEAEVEPSLQRLLGTSFVGREHDCSTLERLLATKRLVTVVGIGGLGKSRLVRHVVDGIAERGGSEACIVRVAAGGSNSAITNSICAALGLSVEVGIDASRLLAEHLHERRMLLIFDGCEHQLEAVRSIVADLLATQPLTNVLATSREPLRIAGETLHRLGPLSLPVERAGTAAIVSSEAGALFLERSYLFSTDVVLNERDREALAQICIRLGGIPLAIELAAARRRLLSIPQIAERLYDPALVLDSATNSVTNQQQTVHQAIAWSFEALADSEREALLHLCIFESSFTIDAAESVIIRRDGAPPLIELLSALIDRSLVIIAPEPNETRYSILDPIREFGLQTLYEGDASAVAYDAAVQYFLRTCERHALPEGEPSPRLAFDAVEREHNNIRAAILGAVRTKADIAAAAQLALSMSLFWQLRGFVGDGRRCAEALRSAPWTAETNSLFGLVELEAATFARLEGDYDVASDIARACRSRAAAGANAFLEAEALFTEAIVNFTRTRLTEARAMLERAMLLYSEVGDDARAGRCGANIALILMSERDYGAADVAMRDALVRLERSDHRRWRAAALGAMGYIERYRGALDTAAAHSREALAAGMRTGDRQLASSALSNLAFVYVTRNDARNARTYIKAGLELLSDGAFVFSILSMLESAARLFVSESRFDDAASALAAFAAIVDRYEISRAEDDRALVADLERSLTEHVTELHRLRRREGFRAMSLDRCVREVTRLLDASPDHGDGDCFGDGVGVGEL